MKSNRGSAASSDQNRKMLRWYPVQWRARYGDEFAAMIEDDLAGQSPTLRYRLSIARSGLNEQLRETGLIGGSASPSEQMRSGALAVLCAFALFIISGISFAKISENWNEAIRRGGPWHLPDASITLMGILAVACAVAVALSALAFLPIFVRFLQSGGWPAIRRRVRWAMSATAATAAVVEALSVWASHLTNQQRNSGFGWYQFLFMIGAILFSLTIATWSAAAVTTTRRLKARPGQLKLGGGLAVLVAACMPIMTAAGAVWWGSMASTAPWFLAGTRIGTSPSPLATNLLVVLVMMTIASGAGIFGMLRVLRSWRLLEHA